MADQSNHTGAGGSGRSRSISKRAASEPGAIDVLGPFDGYAFGEPDAPVPVGAKPPFSVGMLLRYRWSILLTLLFGSALAIPSIWLFMTPVYHARGVIRVAPIVSRMVYRTENNVLVPLYDAFLNTQVSVIRSPKVLQRVLDREDVRNTAWHNEKPKLSFNEPPSRLERLGEVLSVLPRRGTELIDVAVDTLDRRDAKVLVDATLDEYKKFTDESAAESETERLRMLQDQKKTLKDEIESLTELKNNLAKRLGTSAPEQLWSERGTQLNALEAERSNLTRERELAVWDLTLLGPAPEAVEAPDGEEASTETPSSERHYPDDAEWRSRNLELEGVRHQLEIERQQYGELHPRIARLQADVEHRAQILREREKQLDEQTVFVSVPSAPVANTAVAVLDRSALDRRVKRLDRQIELLDKEIASQRAKVDTIADMNKSITTWDEEIGFKRAEYEALRTRLQELEIEGKAPARISVAAYAVQPSRPDRDRRLFLSAFAAFGALMLGLTIAYVRVSFDSRIREVGDVQGAVHGPFLGQLPALLPMEDLMADRDPLIMEQVRIVRTAMLERLQGKKNCVVLITSSSARAGKTSVAVLLARSLAQLGKRTLLVEADLRRPALSENLKLVATSGLAAMLAGQIDDKEALVPTDLDNLDLIPAGARPEQYNAELLASGVFTNCLARWRTEYDFVLLDSPPVPVAADARILAAHADGTVLVLRSAHCRRSEVMRAYLDLQAGGSTLLGTVLVGGHSPGQYGYYGYDYYHASHEDRKALTASEARV